MKRYKAKKCKRCSGLGIIQVMTGVFNETNTNIELTGNAVTICPDCSGLGIKGIKILNSLSLQQCATIASQYNPDEIFTMFHNKTKDEIDITLSTFLSS